MLDSHYRTLEGICLLIEKEWLAFGHKFADRCGHTLLVRNSQKNSWEWAPIFVQFIDCLLQITRQFVTACEFNELFLMTM